MSEETGHDFGWALEQMKAGNSQNPFIDPEGYRSFVVEEEGRYLKQLEEERSGGR